MMIGRKTRLTHREWAAILCALNRALAGEPETDDEDRAAMESARGKILGRLQAPDRED